MNFISNRKWFKTYVLIRQIILLLLLTFLFLYLLKYNDSLLFKWIMAPCSMLMMLVVLFDYRERPTFFELEKYENKLKIRLFIPDYRSFLFFKKKYIKEIVANQHTRIQLQKVAPNFVERDAKYILTLNNTPQAHDQSVKSMPIMFSWADSDDMQNIFNMIAIHNQSILN